MYMYLSIVVDNTDKLNFIQKKAIENRIYDIVYDALPNDKLIIYSLNILEDNSKIENIDPLVQQCPYRDGSKANEWIENPEKLKKMKDERFDKPIEKAIDGILKKEEDSKYSPIIELIQKIKVTVLHKVTTENKDKSPSEKKSIQIHLFSDLLQNSANFSFYRNDDLNRFLKSNQFDKISSNLEGIDFIIWQLNNSIIKISKIAYDFEMILRKMNVGNIERRDIEG